MCFLLYSIDANLPKPRHERGARQTTKLLLVVTFTFLAFLAWLCITQCLWMQEYRRAEKHTWRIVDNSFTLGKLGIVFNSSINWCLYCITGSIFRKQARSMLGLQFTKISYIRRYFNSSRNRVFVANGIYINR